MSRSVTATVLLSSILAAYAQQGPPALEDATRFVTAAVERYHLDPGDRDDLERKRKVRAQFSGCSVEFQTTSEVRELGRWTPRTSSVRFQLNDVDPDGIRIAREMRPGQRPTTFVLTLPCARAHACVRRGPETDREASLAFTSEQMAHRTAAAFRHAAGTCGAHSGLLTRP